MDICSKFKKKRTRKNFKDPGILKSVYILIDYGIEIHVIM